MTDDKILKAKVIIAKLLVRLMFTDIECRTRSNIIAMIIKYDDELHLGINAAAILKRMIDEKLIHQNGTYNDEPYYSTTQKAEPIHI